MRRYKGTFDVFFGMEHRLRKEEIEEQFNREAKEGWRFATSAARIMEEMAGDDDREHTSGGVFVAIDVAWELLCVQKKGQLSRFPEIKEESPRPG